MSTNLRLRGERPVRFWSVIVATLLVTRSDCFFPTSLNRRLTRSSYFGITARPTEKNSYIADESASVQSLYEWLESFEGTNIDSVAVGSDPNTGRRGLYALESVSKGDVICRIASDCAMALQNPSQASQSPATSIPQDAQAFLKGYWKNPNVRKLWAPYLDTLPKNVTTPTPDMYSEEQLWLLEFPRLVNQATARRDDIVKLARVASMTLKELEWASWIISSRSIPLVVPEQQQVEPANEKQVPPASAAPPQPFEPPESQRPDYFGADPPRSKFHNRESGKHSYYERGAAASEKIPFATWIIQPESLNIRPHENDIASDFAAPPPPINQRQSYLLSDSPPRQGASTPSWVMDPQNFAIPTDEYGSGYNNWQPQDGYYNRQDSYYNRRQPQGYTPDGPPALNEYPPEGPPPIDEYPPEGPPPIDEYPSEESPTASQTQVPPLNDDKVEEKKEQARTKPSPVNQRQSYLPPLRNPQQSSYLPIIEEQHPPVTPSWVINPKAFSIPSDEYGSGAVEKPLEEKEKTKPAEGNRFLSQRQAVQSEDDKAKEGDKQEAQEERAPINQKSYLPRNNQRPSSYLPPLDEQKPRLSPSWVINPRAFSIPDDEYSGGSINNEPVQEEKSEPKEGNRFLNQRKYTQDNTKTIRDEGTTEEKPSFSPKESPPPPRKDRKDMEWAYDDRGQVVASRGRRNYIRVLTPLLDMVNHASKEANAKLIVQAYDGFEDALIGLEAIRPIKAGEEITIEYGGGAASSIELLGNYGFIDEDNTKADAEMLRMGGDDCFKSLDDWTTPVEEDEIMLEDLPADDDSNLRTILQFWVQMKKSYSK